MCKYDEQKQEKGSINYRCLIILIVGVIVVWMLLDFIIVFAKEL